MLKNSVCWKGGMIQHLHLLENGSVKLVAIINSVYDTISGGTSIKTYYCALSQQAAEG